MAEVRLRHPERPKRTVRVQVPTTEVLRIDTIYSKRGRVRTVILQGDQSGAIHINIKG